MFMRLTAYVEYYGGWREVVSHWLYLLRVRFILTVLVAAALTRTNWRFDKSWRHAEYGAKAWAYRFVSTVAANRIADGPFWHEARHWWSYT